MVSYSLTMNPFMECKEQSLNYFIRPQGRTDKQTQTNMPLQPFFQSWGHKKLNFHD